MKLPPAYRERVIAQLGQIEAQAYFEALDLPYQRGLRRNPSKPAALPLGVYDNVPWEPNGYYLSNDSDAGAQPLHEAGAYYIQEPSAMMPARALAPKAGEIVLDLCAAPGGKSTQLAQLMGSGLLVCNEPVPGRAQILSRNIERMGIANALVISESPQRLEALWPSLFDAVLVDAPCSGEGMFRRHPQTVEQWNEQSPQGCAQRQRAILVSAIRLLKPGGRLCYSTCTHSSEEDEQNVRDLLDDYPSLTPLPFTVPLENGRAYQAEDGMAHLWPHQVQGEGHFVALMQKDISQDDRAAALMPACDALGKPDQSLAAAYVDFCKAKGALPPFTPNAQMGQTLLYAPPLPPLRGVRVLRAGVALGFFKGKTFFPDHALALAQPTPCALSPYEVTPAQALAYQAGETLACPETLSGYVTVTLSGLALGFGKASGGQIKNHYPKGLRRAAGRERE